MKENLKKLLSKYFSFKKTLRVEELKYLNELLKSDLPLKTCLLLISDNHSRSIIDELIRKMDEGYIIENIISDYLPQDIYPYMTNLLKSLTFSKSLELALKFSDKARENARYITNALAYPIGLLFVSVTGLYLFDAFGLDSIMDMLKSFEINFGVINILRIVLRIFIRVFYFLFILVSLLFLYFRSDKRISIAYIVMCKYFPIEFVKIYFTEEFMSLFVLMSSLGYKTKEIIDILKGLRNKPIVSLLSFHLDDRLMKGESFINASKQQYLDDTLSKFINISIYSKNFIGILNNYLELSRMKIENKARFFTKVIQMASYIFIGFVIIFIYQVLFLPMQAISGI